MDLAPKFGQEWLWREIIESKYGGWRNLNEQRVKNSKVSL